MSRGSRAATPKSKIVWVRNNNLSKKQLSEQETRTAAHFESISKLLTWFVRLLLFFPVRFRLNSFSADLTFDFRCETIIFSWLPWREPRDLTRPGLRPGEFALGWIQAAIGVNLRLMSLAHGSALDEISQTENDPTGCPKLGRLFHPVPYSSYWLDLFDCCYSFLLDFDFRFKLTMRDLTRPGQRPGEFPDGSDDYA